MPKRSSEKENEKNYLYKLSVGAKTEKLKFDPFFETLDLRLYFGSDEAQLAQAAKVKQVLDTMSARFERTPGITVERKSGSVRVKKGDVSIFYYNQNEKGELTGLYIRGNGAASRAANEKNKRSYEANQANPAVREGSARTNFIMTMSVNRNMGNMGIKGLLNQYEEARKVPGADAAAVKTEYQKKLAAELSIVENNYLAWERFLSTATTLKPELIEEDKKSIRSEKDYVADMKVKLKALFR